MTLKDAIKTYQCPGCVNGPYPKCYKKDSIGSGCSQHCPGTMIMGLGTIILGMEKGFNRVGPVPLKSLNFQIFKDKEDLQEFSPTKLSMTFKNNGLYDNFNIPVWKYLDEHGNTLVRGLSPRINIPFLHIFLWDARSEVNCLELTKSDIDAMD